MTPLDDILSPIANNKKREHQRLEVETRGPGPPSHGRKKGNRLPLAKGSLNAKGKRELAALVGEGKGERERVT